MEVSNLSVNPNSLVNILTLRYDPSIPHNLPKKTWKDFVTTNNPLTSEIIEKSICDSIEKKLKMFNGKKTDPVMTRVDVVCCLDNKSQNSLDYYLNEIEEGGIAGSYTNIKTVNYPIVEVLADAYVRKANELLK